VRTTPRHQGARRACGNAFGRGRRCADWVTDMKISRKRSAREWCARGACHRARIRATRWLCAPYALKSRMRPAIRSSARRAIRAWTPCANCPSRQHAARDRACRVGQIKTMLPHIPPHEGTFRDRHERGGGERWPRRLAGVSTPTNELIRLRGDCDGTGTRPVVDILAQGFRGRPSRVVLAPRRWR
jgi:hypothetical protein